MRKLYALLTYPLLLFLDIGDSLKNKNYPAARRESKTFFYKLMG